MIYLPASAQDAMPAAPPAKETPAAALPSDPKELILLAAKTNGLTGDNVKPWHLKATWKMLDEQGSLTDQGTFEEYWVSNNKYKLTFTTKTGSRTEYGTEKGILNSDNEGPVGTHDLRRLWISPMPASQFLGSYDFMLRQIKVEGEDFNCLNRKGANGDPTGPTYCLEPHTSILRFTEYQSGSERAIRRKVVSFQGHYFAEDLQTYYSLGNKRSLTIHLENIEALNPIDDAVFTPPSSAVPQKVEVRTMNINTVNIAPGVMAGMLLKKVPPEYPLYAKAQGIQGTVVIQATISKTGRNESLRVISGPAQLQQAALDAVKQWIYKPYMLNGEPVAVETTINVNFTLGNQMR
jgi:TonB family protein